MSKLTIRLPCAKHNRLKDLAHSKGANVNKLIEEWATIALIQQLALASNEVNESRGNRVCGLQPLDQLDAYFKKVA
jgi:hypothetical protein